MKGDNKIWIFITAIIIFFACSKTENSNRQVKNDGKQIFKNNCVICHGVKGNMGTNGAFDLTISSLTLDQRIAVITHGRKTMTAFEKVLSHDEIVSVAEYTLKLSNL